jgi:hypothetical protein
MNKMITAGFIACTVLATFTGCKKDKGGNASGTITITTTYKGAQSLYLAGSGKATINWGDGTAKQTVTLGDYNAFVTAWNNDDDISPWQTTHPYVGTEPKTITITGNITGMFTNGYGGATALDVSKMPALKFLNCSDGNLGTLDVSKNTALTYLNCGGNNLTTLDVSKNTALTNLYCGYNSINGDNMINLLNGLPTRSATAKGTAYIEGNTGFDNTNSGYKTAKASAQTRNWVINDQNV